MSETNIVCVMISSELAMHLSCQPIHDKGMQPGMQHIVQLEIQTDVIARAIIEAVLLELGGTFCQSKHAWIHLETTLENVSIDEMIHKAPRLRYERMRIESW